MPASPIGSLVLLVAGLAFLTAAALVFRRARSEPGARWGLAVDVLVGLVALGDGVVGASGSPERVVVWAAGSAVLLVVGALLVVHRGRRQRSA